MIVLGQYPDGRLGLVDDNIKQRVASYVTAARQMGLPDEDIEDDIFEAFHGWEGCCADDVAIDGNVVLLGLFA